MTTREADRPLQRFVRSARPVSFATAKTYTTSRDTTSNFTPVRMMLNRMVQNRWESRAVQFY